MIKGGEIITLTLHQLMPLATIAAAPSREKLFNLVVVFGLATIVLFSIGFLAMALAVNHNMREEADQPKPKAKPRPPTTSI